MELLDYLRKFLKENKFDYLIVNATNEFLVEYPLLEENSRYFLTNFKGDTGDALVSKDKVHLFVDGRFHEQADNESNKITTVVKMPVEETFIDALFDKVKPNKTLAIVAQKTSQSRYEVLKQTLKLKNIDVVLIDFDPVMKFLKKNKPEHKAKIEIIGNELSGMSADDKFKKVTNNLKSDEAFLITNLEEISYMCNLRDFSINYSTKICGKCIIKKDKAILFTDESIKQFSKYFEIKPLSGFKKALDNLSNISRIYVDKVSTNAYDYGLIDSKAVPLEISPLKLMKSVKCDAEIKHLKEGFAKTDEAVNATREYILSHDNISEYDICTELEKNFYKFGAKSLSFKSIVAIDENSALAHYSNSAKDKILNNGSIVLIDCGAYYEGGLATDSTRVFLKGKASKLQKQVYTAVLKAHLKAYNTVITEHTTGYKIDKKVRKLFNEIEPKGFAFSHGLGHGIGINVHEAPPNLSVSDISKVNLEKNMCFTIEPGLYKAGKFGVRLENSCYIAEDKNGKKKIQSFSNLPFEKELIDFSLLTNTEKRQLKHFVVK